MVRTNWDGCKVRIKDETESRKVQERLFELGYKYYDTEPGEIGEYKDMYPWLSIWDDKDLTFGEERLDFEEVTVADILGERFNFDGVPTYTPANNDVWLKCLCVECQKKMQGKMLESDPSVIMVKDLEEVKELKEGTIPLDLTWATTLSDLMGFRKYCLEKMNGDDKGVIKISDELKKEIITSTTESSKEGIRNFKTFADWEIYEEPQKTLWDKRKYPTSAGSVYRDEDIKETLKDILAEAKGCDFEYWLKEVIKKHAGKELVE